METTNIQEKIINAKSGIPMLLAFIGGIVASFVVIILGAVCLEGGVMFLGAILLIAGIVGTIAFPILCAGLKTVKPNEAKVFTLFGKYYGTIKESGFYYINPFCEAFSPTYNAAKQAAAVKTHEAAQQGQSVVIPVNLGKGISLKTQTLNNERQKVNDVLGNPIIIGAVVIWRVADPTKAVFSVENYADYLSIQADSTVRNIARLYPYDLFDDDDPDGDGIPEKTLRGSAIEIADSMRQELQTRVENAGLVVEEVRITHLAYAEEIAAAMLQRQQAVAIIAARQKIVDGAVGMVKMAIDKLGEDEIVVLDEERKAAMVSNLLVVLCGNKDAQPIVNSGSIY